MPTNLHGYIHTINTFQPRNIYNSHTDRYLDYNTNHPISAKLSVINTFIHKAKQVCSTPELLAKEMGHLHKVLQDNHYTAQFSQQGKPQQKTNKKPNPSIGKFIEGARVVIPYIKGLSEQYRQTLAKYRDRVFFKGTSTIKPLLMHPKDPIPDAQKTDIIYHWKCPAHNCTAEYIGETSRLLKERVSDHRNQTTSAIKNHHISTKHPKTELKDFTIIDRDSNTLHHRANEALHICIKDPSLNRNIGKIRIPSVFNKLLKPHRQLELPYSSVPQPKGAPSLLGHPTQKTISTSHLLDLHLQYKCPSLCSHLSNIKTTKPLDLHLQRNT